MRRCARTIARGADNLCAFVLHRGDYPFLLRVPPLISMDAMPAAVRAGEQGGMSRGGARIGVVVIAVAEVGAVIEE